MTKIRRLHLRSFKSIGHGRNPGNILKVRLLNWKISFRSRLIGIGKVLRIKLIRLLLITC